MGPSILGNLQMDVFPEPIVYTMKIWASWKCSLHPMGGITYCRTWWCLLSQVSWAEVENRSFKKGFVSKKTAQSSSPLTPESSRTLHFNPVYHGFTHGLPWINCGMTLPFFVEAPWFPPVAPWFPPSCSMVSRLISRDARCTIWGLHEPNSRFCSSTGNRSCAGRNCCDFTRLQGTSGVFHLRFLA